MSRRRPYLDLKSSILNLFRTPARWLKDITSKESIFEKPYLNQDYRAMHLNLPSPDWPSTPGGEVGGRGFFPDKPGTWTFKFDPGICTLGVLTLGCGESGSLGVSIGLLPPGDADKSISWSAKTSNSDLIRITGIEQGISGSINLQASEEETGTATICVTGSLQGRVIKSLTVPFLRGSEILDYREAASLPAFNREYYKSHLYSCGCVDLEITCCDDSEMAWDSDTSAETIAQSASATIAITDSLGTGGNYTWSVSGTGFWLDSEFTITTLVTSGLSAILYSDATACGAATITVVGCNGAVVTGYVRCTVGQWSATKYDVCEPCPYHTGWDCTIIIGDKQYYAEMTSSTDGGNVCPYKCVPGTFYLGQGPLSPATCPVDAPSGYAWITYSYYNKWIC